MTFRWKPDILPLACIAAMFVLAAVAWPQAPDSIPIHWGLDGQPDGFAGRFLGLLGAPLAALGLYVLFYVLPIVDPRRENYRKFWSKYLLLRNILIVMLTGLSATAFLWAVGIRLNTGIAVFLLSGLLFLLLGNYMAKLRPTWFVGIRTPWTLSSAESWDRTHRLGGRLFVAAGMLMIIAALFGRRWMYTAAGAFVIGAILFLCIYSFLVWRKDPKAAPAGTLSSDRNP